MKNLTDSAQKRLDEYLNEVKISLRTCTSVDAGEVEWDIREHIETELQGHSEPVSLKDLEAVLDRLGSPSQWVPEEEISWWRKIILRLRTGPEDWRLAYISFGLFILAFVLRGRIVFLILLLASFVISRAALSVAEDHKTLGAQKWLIYPSLLIVYGFAVVWPAILVLFNGRLFCDVCSEWLSGDYHLYEIRNYPTLLSLAGVAVALWWGILGTLSMIWKKVPQKIFRPFADGFKRKWAAVIILVGIVLVVLCGLSAAIFNSHVPAQITFQNIKHQLLQ